MLMTVTTTGNFDEETWLMSKNGTTWTPSGLTYAQLNNLDLYNLAGAGTLKVRAKDKGSGQVQV